jgi:Icc-related predicted phosphoesterase
MKLVVASDLHLEFGDFSANLIDAPEADVLVLAGDIVRAFELEYFTKIPNHNLTKTGVENAKRYSSFIKKCCQLYKHVTFVIGNHEHYFYQFDKTSETIKKAFEKFDNLHILERNRSPVIIDDVVFIGDTLWTDMNGNDIDTIEWVHENLNDFINISFEDDLGVRELEPEDVIDEHLLTLSYLQQAIDEHKDKKVVVVTHHAPSKQSKKTMKNLSSDEDVHLNSAYSSNLENFIIERPQIKLWCHGHIHTSYNYQIGNTTVLCNPRGYVGVESLSKEFEWVVVEV